ncbi:MAG: hypothetical protein ILO36_02740, partial [Abditibacteriota bacterium]|nr:hypothetical protein [Abditibacteriota bacterium]
MKFVLFLFFLFLSLEAWAVADEELKEKVSRPRWLSIPGSRIVLNPTGISHTGALVSHLSGGALAGMVLNAGYFYGEHPERVADIWSWKPSDPEAAGNSLLSGRRTDLVSLNWKDTGSRGRKEGNRIILTQKDEKYGYIECEAIKTDVSKEPLIILDIKNGDGAKWALKVGLEGEHDISINPGCSEDGLFVFDLTGYIKSNPEDKKMYVRVFTVGPRGCSVTVNALYLEGIGDSARGFEEIT